MEKAETGQRGEALACQYLQDHGHLVLEKNCRKGHLEIDLITIDATGIHFVEVKSRTAPVMAPPQDNVGYLKQRRLTAAAQRWLHSARDPRIRGNEEVLFDIVAVTFNGPETVIEYIPQAFIPIYT